MKQNIKLSTQGLSHHHHQQQQRCNDDEDDVALQVQPSHYKQRQQQLLQSYKHCKRRRKSSTTLQQQDHIVLPATTTTCDLNMFTNTATQIKPLQTKCWSILKTKSLDSLKDLRQIRKLLKKIILLVTILLITTTCIRATKICQPIEAATIASAAFPATSATSIQGFQIPPLNALLKAAAAQDSQISSNNSPSSTLLPASSSSSSGSSISTSSSPLASASSTQQQQQQRQLQQQQLFALLKLNSMPQAATQETKKSSSSSLALRTKNLKDKQRYNHRRRRPPHRHLKEDNTDYNDDDDDDDDNGEDEINFLIPRNTLLETTGFVADDGQQYEKAEKALAAAGIIPATGSNAQQQQSSSSASLANNNLNCPKECKCLNDYFDCGKKHLDRVPPLPGYVQIIDFIGNKLNDTTVLQIKNLPELNKLVLKRNQLETVPKFVGLSSLKQLSLAHNRIQKISAEALAALPKLKALDLSKNYLHTVEASYFPTANRLAHLILNGNEIASISETAFANLADLLDLELNNNRLTLLPAGVFENLSKLRKLSLNYNHLEINWSTFRGLVSLQKLFLKSNNIRALQDGVFHVMTAIETIELDHNYISSLSRQGLFNLTKLHHLSLSNNSISRIELDTWEFTQSLITLDLSHNNITEFKPQHLDCLQRLKHLNLGHNKIQYLMENTFDCVKNLEDLNLRRNKLSWIIEDPGAAPPFKALRKLKKLDLYGNNLKQINTKSLSGLSNLESLNLGGNALASIQSGAFDHMTNLQKLMFKSLNFICDCDILWFRRWLNRHLQTTSNQKQLQTPQQQQNSAQAVCGYPEHLLDRELLSLQQNELTCAETPKPVLIQEPSNQLAVKGANITMECRATSPTAASLAATDELKIKWRHDNHNIKERDRNTPPANSLLTPYTTTETQIHHDSSNNQTTIIGYLRLYNMSYESAGKYQCVVSNAFGTTYSQKFKMSIGIHPSFLQIPSNLTIDSGDTARLVCSATGDPMPEIALQKFGASDFPAATERRLQVLREENAFVIINAKPIDSGIYTCTAESPAGEIKVNASLIVNDKPQPTIPVVHKEIVVGKSSVLECLSDIAAELNQPHREWYKDNKPFHITPTLDTDRYYFTSEKELLIIVNSQSVDSGHYRCEITDNSKTYTMQMELLVVKEDFSQNVIIIGVIVVTVACIIIGSLIVWIILFYQKKKLYMNAGNGTALGGSRVAAANSHNILTSSRGSTLDQTQMTTLSRTYLRSPRDNYNHAANQRPRSLAALEMNGGRYQGVEDENQPLTEQRNFLIVTTTPNYQQLLMQRQAHEEDRTDDEHLTLEYLRLNRSHDGEHHQDHLSSKDSGTGSDAAVKRSLEDFSISLMPNASTPTSNAGVLGSLLKPGARASLAKQDTDEDEEYNIGPVNITTVQQNGSGGSTEDTEDFTTSPTLGVSVYQIDEEIHNLSRNNNHSPALRNYKTSPTSGDGGGGCGNDDDADGGGAVSLADSNLSKSAYNAKPASIVSSPTHQQPQNCKASTNFSTTPTSSSLSPPPIPLRTQTVDI
ncbi:leucine-rich repeats and immunoglobulin-like domains protein 3 [Lucilia cuprina]|uniref:leucine-rich repeats and immunoglobulin-like domains protein 3 n=1 Tax=Lucilia cuprina TaxID=7375 RepID=UPI001F063E63|nr:leucine-rich repeats and immunoglobulin-like domains protein 3 [Lucilia cuprina]